MNNINHIKIILGVVILTIGIWHSQAQSKPTQRSLGKDITMDVGRINPFGKILHKKKPTLQKNSESDPLFTTLPDLFLETITLKFLDAKSLRTAMTNMSSEYGSISVDNKSNQPSEESDQ